MWYDSSICVLHAHPWLIHMCDVTHLYLWQNVCVAWRIHMCDITPLCMRYDSFICVLHRHAWPIHMHDVTHSYMWHDSFSDNTRMTHLYVRHDAFLCVLSLLHICGMTHSYVCCTDTHDSFICVTWRIHTCDTMCVWHDAFICAISLIHTCGTTYSYACCIHTHDSLICVAWRIHMCDITCHDSFISRPNVTPSREKRHRTSQWVMSSGITLTKRDLHCSKETNIYEKRHTLLKRDLSWRIHMCDITLIEMNPSPPGGVLFWHVQSQTEGGRRTHEPITPNFKNQYSLLHLECRFFNLKSQLMF